MRRLDLPASVQLPFPGPRFGKVVFRPALFSLLRRGPGLDRRISRDGARLPWTVVFPQGHAKLGSLGLC